MEQTYSRRSAEPATDWLETLARYRTPDQKRSLVEILITVVPFAALWAAAWAALSIGYWATLLLSLPAAAFLVRIFMIQHDCGHGSFFRNKRVNDWVGRATSLLTLTSYEDWRRSHALHHTTSGNLDHRGFGDIQTLTVVEFRALSRPRRLAYRLYRHPLVMFGLGPAYLFWLRNRLPSSFRRADRRAWLGVMATNAAIGAAAVIMMTLLGVWDFLLVHAPITLIAASVGVWLFYVQHQFEDTFWAKHANWKQADAALYGSSHYALPRVLRWITANIGVHHVHHLSSRIPFYRLQQVLRDHPRLAGVHRLTLRESLSCLRLRLWDEQHQRLVSFRDARA